MSKLTDSLTSGLQTLGTGILSSLIGGSFSKSASRDMMRYQDAINDQNALDAYNRQRSLMMEAPSLQKAGMLRAGYNTAFGSNGSVQSVGEQPSSNVGLGSVDANKMPTSVQTLLYVIIVRYAVKEIRLEVSFKVTEIHVTVDNIFLDLVTRVTRYKAKCRI